MISQVYVDNYKCFENTEINLDSFHLLMGDNGTGKTALLEVLAAVKALVIDEEKIDSVLPAQTLTRWQSRPVQTFELHVNRNDGRYRYRVEIEHDKSNNQQRIKEEHLTFNGNPLFSFEMGEVQLYRDNFSTGPKYPFDWGRSGLATIMPRSDNKRLSWFKSRLSNVYILRIHPPSIESESEREVSTPAPGFKNFTSWYRHASQEHPKRQIHFFDDLEDTLEGFRGLKLSSSGGQTRTMTLSFKHGGESNQEEATASYTLGELSDGQRALVVLYALIRFTLQEDVTLCIDEPGNYLGLTEIQPWLLEAQNVCQDNKAQTLLVSHHPELIDFLASEQGILFSRANAGPVRTGPVEASEEGAIAISDLMARGWLNE